MGFTSVQKEHATTYNDRMRASMKEKLFFLDKLKGGSVVVDYGCADGSLLKQLREHRPDSVLIGYDVCPDAIASAKANFLGAYRDTAQLGAVHFTTNWEEVERILRVFDNGNACLIASSVYHEVHSYSDGEAANEFWRRVSSKHFDQLAFRDMAMSHKDWGQDCRGQARRVMDHCDRKQLFRFIDEWGGISKSHQLNRFLLTYHYKENFEREVQEDYLPESAEKILEQVSRIFPEVSSEHSRLPYLEQKVHKDFGVNFFGNTHLKLFASR